MSISHDLSKSSEHFSNQVHGISFNYKRNENKKRNHSEFYQNDEQSYDLEFEEKTEIRGGKFRNVNNFKPSTKQTVDQNEYKKLKKKYFEDIEEKSEEEQQNEEQEISEEEEKEKKSRKNKSKGGGKKENKNNKNKKNKKNDNTDTPPSKLVQNIYTVKNKPNTKIIIDDDEDEEEEINNNKKEESDENKEKNEDIDLDIDIYINNNSNDSNDSENEKKEKEKKPKKKLNKKNKNKNKKNKNKNKKNIKKEKESSSEEKEEDSENSDNNKNNKVKQKQVYSKKWDEEEYQALLSESKNFIPFKDYDMNKFILTISQMNNIKNNTELYDKYNHFLSLKKKQDKIQFETLVKNILIIFNNICKNKKIDTSFKVPSLFKNDNKEYFKAIDYKSSEKTAYFDLFISFISFFLNDYENFVESTSIKGTNKLMVPFHALAFIFSSQVFFYCVTKLIQIYYNRFLEYKIIPIYTKLNEEFIQRINTRHIIWKQFEAPFLFFKNRKKLYLKEENGESKIDEKKVESFADKIGLNITNAYNTFVNDTVKRHNEINKFNINDKRINLINNNTSVPSSLYNQINGDVTFKLKMNLYKYKMKQMKIRKLCKLNDAKIKKNEFEKKVKNTIFKKAAFYMSSCDVVQDFLDNYN